MFNGGVCLFSFLTAIDGWLPTFNVRIIELLPPPSHSAMTSLESLKVERKNVLLLRGNTTAKNIIITIGVLYGITKKIKRKNVFVIIDRSFGKYLNHSTYF